MSSTFRDLLGGRSQRTRPHGNVRSAMTSAASAAQGRFAQMIEGIIDRLLDALFKHAESRLGSDEQRQTLGAYSAIYENRGVFAKSMEKNFRQRIETAVDDFLNNRLTRPGVMTVPKTTELSLVDTGEMERQVLAGTIGARAEGECFEAYRELNGRLATVAGLLEIATSSNPFRPELLVVAIDDAWRDLRPESAEDLLVLQRVNNTVLGDMGPFVDVANNALAEAGFEPTRATGIVSSGRQGGTSTTPGAASAAAAAAADEAMPRRTGVFRRIVEALAQQMGVGPSAAAGGTGPAGTATLPGAAQDAAQPQAPAASLSFDEQQLLAARQAAAQAFSAIVPPATATQAVGALTALQRAQVQQPAAFGQALMVEPMIGDDGQPLGSNYMDPLSQVDVALRTPLRFVNVIRNIADSDIGKQANQVDSMVIELVARLFDFVFEDGNLPDAIKVLLSRLQIPVLKAAMLDTEFFERDNHPARRLVNALANAGLGWEEQDGREDPLFMLIERTVQRVLEEFQEDLSLFDRLADEVDEYVHQVEAENAMAAAPTLAPVREEAIHEEEKLLALRNARRAVEDRLRDARTLPFVAYFLRNAWAEYLGDLLIEHVEEDNDETPLRNALDTADDLLWSVEPKQVPDERRRLLVKIPSMERQLRSGMTRVAMPEPDALEFLSSLDDRWAGAVIGEPINIVEEVPEPEPEPEPDAEMQQVLDLRPGAILEMTKDDGTRLCYKLGWISEGKSRFLLTNRLNSAPLIVTSEHLAGRLRAGRLRIIDRGPLMDRAMNSILTALEEVRYPEVQAAL